MSNKNTLLSWLNETLSNAKARDCVIIDVSSLTTITDLMVICTGTSTRHLNAIAQKVAEQAKTDGLPLISIEGEPGSDWVLVDLDDVIVHIMQQDARDFYQLERLWQK